MTTHPSIEKLPHHEQLEFCYSRASYRQGRKLTAVKVYTVNDESKFLIISGIPAIKILEELERLCLRYGNIERFEMLPDYPQEEFAEAYLVKYVNIKCARFAKKKIDGMSFYGGALHACYAPELESIEDTREKLADRRKSIAALTRYKTNACEVNKTKQTFAKVSKGSAAQRYMSQIRPDVAQSFQTYFPATSEMTAESDSNEFSLREATPKGYNEFDASGNISNNKTNLEETETHYQQHTFNSGSSNTKSNIEASCSNSKIPNPNSSVFPEYKIDTKGPVAQQTKRALKASSISQNTKKIKLFKNVKILSHKSSEDNN